MAAIEEENIDFRRYISLVFSYWWILVSVPALLGLAGYMVSKSRTPIYEARASILVEYSRSISRRLDDFQQSNYLADTYVWLATASPFMEQVDKKNVLPFSAGTLQGMTRALSARDPPRLELRARHTDPVVAADTAQVLAEEFIQYVIERRLGQIARLQQAAAAQGLDNFGDLVAAQYTAIDTLSLLQPASPPDLPVVPKTRRNTILSGMLGLIFAVAIVLLLDNLRDNVGSPDEMSRRFGVTSLGTVLKWSPKDILEHDLALVSSQTSSAAEALRQVGANFRFATVNLGNSFVVSSPGPQEGKSTITSNLAVSLAQAGRRVIVVDADLRRPMIHRLFGMQGRESGLSNLLAEPNTDISKVIRHSDVDGVDVITGGPTPPNPGQLLGSDQMNSLLDQLKEMYDTVLIDSPPILPVADASMIASQVDGSVIIVDGVATRSNSLKMALETIQKTNVTVIGVVINKLKRPRFSYGYPYYYPYYYSDNAYYGNISSEDGTSTDRSGRSYLGLASVPKKIWRRIQRR